MNTRIKLSVLLVGIGILLAFLPFNAAKSFYLKPTELLSKSTSGKIYFSGCPPVSGTRLSGTAKAARRPGTTCGIIRFALELIPGLFQLAAKLGHPARRDVESLRDGAGPFPHGQLLGYFPIPGRQ